MLSRDTNLPNSAFLVISNFYFLKFLVNHNIGNMVFQKDLSISCLKQYNRHGATRGHFGAVTPQTTACAPQMKIVPPPQSEDCTPKKLTCSGLLECKSRPKTPKLVFTAVEFVSKNCFFVIFVDLHRISLKFWAEDLFFFSLVFT